MDTSDTKRIEHRSQALASQKETSTSEDVGIGNAKNKENKIA